MELLLKLQCRSSAKQIRNHTCNITTSPSKSIQIHLLIWVRLLLEQQGYKIQIGVVLCWQRVREGGGPEFTMTEKETAVKVKLQACEDNSYYLQRKRRSKSPFLCFQGQQKSTLISCNKITHFQRWGQVFAISLSYNTGIVVVIQRNRPKL